MVETNKKTIEYELRDFRDGRYLWTMMSTRYKNTSTSFYQIGDEVILTDQIIHKNNSKRLRICIIADLEPHEKLIRAYLIPTKREFIPFSRFDMQKISKPKVNGADEDGSEDWMKA